jgi:hypothetical protein
MKVVINVCYGGFGLSHEALVRYFEIKGINVYPEKGEDHWGFWTYWIVKPEDRMETKDGEAFHSMSTQERIAYNKMHSEQVVYEHSIARHDPALIQVVEELGDKANGTYSDLKVVEIPDDVDYEISEYDGNEHIAESHRTWC